MRLNEVELCWSFGDDCGSAGPPPAEDAAVMSTVRFARAKLGFNPDPKQEMVLDESIRRGILNCTRQWGKSTVMAIKALHQAVCHPGTLTLVISPSERQSAMLVQKVRWMATKKLGLALKKDGINKVSIVFPNGSTIVGLPENEEKIRGFSDVRLLLVDEAALVDEALYEAVTPMLAVSDGKLWLLSTPRGQRGFFYREWTGKEPWMRLKVPATECPRLSTRFLEEERRRKDERTFQQEYMCAFHDDRTSLFPRHIVERSVRSDLEPILLDLPWVKEDLERQR